MNEELENKTEENTTVPLYPEPTKGALTDDHSNYGKNVEFAGGDPDKNNKAYFFIFVLMMCFLFAIAVSSLSGESFLF